MTDRQLPAVLHLADAELGRGYLTRSDLMQADLYVLLANQASEVVGFISYEILDVSDLAQHSPELYEALPTAFHSTKRIGKIGSLAVAHSWQQQGIGMRLMSNALEQLAASVPQVFLLAWRSAATTNLERLARKLGFSPVAVITDYWAAESQQQGYACPACGQPPCHCSAVVFCKSL